MLDSWLRKTLKLRNSVVIAKGGTKGVPIVSKVSWYCFRFCQISYVSNTKLILQTPRNIHQYRFPRVYQRRAITSNIL